MVKLKELISAAEAADGPYYAVEFFPPRTPEGVAKLYERCGRIAHQSGCMVYLGAAKLRICADVHWREDGAPATCEPVAEVDNSTVPNRTCVRAEPLYADVTWGAGGSTSDLTLELCTKLKQEHGFEVNMHLTW